MSIALLSPVWAAGEQTSLSAREQDFIITAYYSPLPSQCCYVTGSYETDRILNGNGTTSADGTSVYPGMIAAPSSYAFGTRVRVPGLGNFTVHDRGGAILELGQTHRLDIWAGAGEEGLARALAFGVRHVSGTVYPDGSDQPPESFQLTRIPAPIEELTPYVVSDTDLLGMHPKFGDRSLSVSLLQQQLKKAGVFAGPSTGLFGQSTRASLMQFISLYRLAGSGTELTDRTAAFLIASNAMTKQKSPVSFIGAESSQSDIQQAERLLRYLGYYRGRTDGVYGERLVDSIVKFQQEQQLVADSASPGAGRIGPRTRKVLVSNWQRIQVAKRAERLLALKRVREILVKKEELVSRLLSKGNRGSVVSSLQKFLAIRGFFPHDKINGNYGILTRESVIAYQLDRGVIASTSEKGAGTVGPLTLKALRSEQVRDAYKMVREKGWNAL